MHELAEHFAVSMEEDFIPEDILYEIVSFLPAKDLFVAEKVSVNWANACAHIKWIRILPEWKMKKLHPNATYDEKREYAKKEMKEFVVEKNATKLHANITRKITAANKYLREIHPIVDVYTFYTSTALVSILIALLAMDIKTWTNTIIWLVALCSAASFVCSRALMHHLNIPDVIMLVGLGISSSAFSVWACIKALEGSVLAWIFIILASSGLTFFSSSLPKRIANGFYLTTLLLFMFFCCGYMGYLWVVYLPMVPFAAAYAYNLYTMLERWLCFKFLLLLFGQLLFVVLYPIPASWLCMFMTYPFLYNYLRPRTRNEVEYL